MASLIESSGDQMSDSIANSVEQKRVKRWRVQHSLIVGLILGLAFVIANEVNLRRSRQQILGMLGLPSGLLLTDADAFERFKRDLAFQYDGLPAFPIVDAIQSSLLKAEFPDHFFVEVFVEYRFWGITLSRPYLHGKQIWAISRKGGPNRRFSRGIPDFLEVVALLGSAGKKIQSVEDAEVVRRVFFELRGAGSFSDPAEGTHARVGQSVWRIAGSRTLDGDLSILEIYLDQNDVVESGWLTFERRGGKSSE